MSRLSSALIAHYKMNDNAATATVVDSTGSHNGTYKDAGGNVNTDTGASQGTVNGALDFDGTDEYVEVADHTDFTPALTPFSISAYGYVDDATNFRVASKGVYNTDGEWMFGTHGADTLLFYLMDESVANCRIGRSYSVALTTYEGQWVHLVATYDGGTVSSGVKLYLNGVRVDDGDLENNGSSFVAVEDLAHAVWIGRYDTNYANGLIDNVMFFSIELSASEAEQLCNNNKGTEILAEAEQSVSPQRFNTSKIAQRQRYDFP